MADQKTLDTLTPDVAALLDLSLPALRTLWQRHYQSDPPRRMSRELLTRSIAYRLQEKVFGGLSRQTKAKLKAYADGRFRHTDTKAHKSTVVAKPGTQFVRQWHGRTYTVTATSDGGFVYGNQRYRSLSHIARSITGPRWSGPAFFGLKAHLIENDIEAPIDCAATRGKA